jgi:hypothetical protein
MTRLDGCVGTGREFDEAFAHFLIESGFVPATTVKNAWQARWRGPQWSGAVALSSRMLTVREASAALQLQATTDEPFGACAYHLGILSHQQIAELSLMAYWQRRTLSDCLVEDQGTCARGIAELRQCMNRAVRHAHEVPPTPSKSVFAAC